MVYKKPIIDYLPSFLQEYKEIKNITATEQKEFDLLWQKHEKTLKNAFIKTTDIEGIKRWEKIVGINARADASLEERRFSVRVKTNEDIPYTYRSLVKKLTSLCGKDGYSVLMNPSKYIIDIKIELAAKNNFDAVKEMVKRVLPANIVCNVELLYNQHKDYIGSTYGQMVTYSHDQLRNEVI